MKKLTLTLLVLPLALVACNGEGGTPSDAEAPPIEVQVETPAASTGEIPPEESEADIVFDLTGENFVFMMNGEENPDLVVQEGDTVQINFTSTQGLHDWVVDEFNATTEQVQTNNSTSVTFVADQTGEFAYYCSVGTHRADGMEGSLVVE